MKEDDIKKNIFLIEREIKEIEEDLKVIKNQKLRDYACVKSYQFKKDKERYLKSLMTL